MSSILAIDPGSSQSAWLQFDGTRPRGFGLTANDVLVRALRTGGLPDVVVIEKVESYGMAVGAEVFDTVFWAGRFAEAVHRIPVVLLPRRAVKLALCGDSRAKDANIRAALLDRFGGSAAVGRIAPLTRTILINARMTFGSSIDGGRAGAVRVGGANDRELGPAVPIAATGVGPRAQLIRPARLRIAGRSPRGGSGSRQGSQSRLGEVFGRTGPC